MRVRIPTLRENTDLFDKWDVSEYGNGRGIATYQRLPVCCTVVWVAVVLYCFFKIHGALPETIWMVFCDCFTDYGIDVVTWRHTLTEPQRGGVVENMTSSSCNLGSRP